MLDVSYRLTASLAHGANTSFDNTLTCIYIWLEEAEVSEILYVCTIKKGVEVLGKWRSEYHQIWGTVDAERYSNMRQER